MGHVNESQKCCFLFCYEIWDMKVLPYACHQIFIDHRLRLLDNNHSYLWGFGNDHADQCLSWGLWILLGLD